MEMCKTQISGNKLPGMYQVKLRLHNETERFTSLFFLFTEMWLMCNCKSLWYMERPAKQTSLVIGFQDPKEAIFFKLSKQFDRASGDSRLAYFCHNFWLTTSLMD